MCQGSRSPLSLDPANEPPCLPCMGICARWQALRKASRKEATGLAACDQLGVRCGRPLECSEDKLFLSSLLPKLEEIAHSHAGGSHVMLSGFGVQEAEYGASSFLDRSTTERLVAIARSQVEAIEKSVNFCLLSVRILLSPPGATAQPWHLDYAGPGLEQVRARTVFVALTRASADNCTELLRFRTPSQSAAFERRRAVCNGRIDVTKADVRAVPVCMSQFDVTCVDTSRVVHRRGRNTSNFVRMTLNVDYSLETKESLEEIGFVDDDTESAKEYPFRTVGPAIVDDLHSEVVVHVV